MDRRLTTTTMAIALLSAVTLLAACGGGDSATQTPTPTPTPAPGPSTVPPAPAGANFEVLPCLSQPVVAGRTVANLVVPDTLALDLGQAPGFPNGRQLQDPVIDLTLAVLFLDLTKERVTRFVELPLNPPANDLPFRAEFPYLAPAQGNPPVGPVAMSGFNFRTDPESAYVRVDRMGMPAVATAVIGSNAKAIYNDANPLDDTNLKFLDEIKATLKGLTDALSDDFAAAGLNMCATPK